jgi:hypothetical protein
VLDVPEWPSAEVVLWQLIQQLVARLPRRDTEGGAVSGDKQLAPLAISLVGIIVARLQQMRSFVQHNKLELPASIAEVRKDGRPDQQDEVEACICGVHTDSTNSYQMIDCDICHRWFHAHCVGLTPEHTTLLLQNQQQWHCDECRIRVQVDLQKVRSAKFAQRSEAAKTSTPAPAPASAEQKKGKKKAAAASAAAAEPAQHADAGSAAAAAASAPVVVTALDSGDVGESPFAILSHICALALTLLVSSPLVLQCSSNCC